MSVAVWHTSVLTVPVSWAQMLAMFALMFAVLMFAVLFAVSLRLPRTQSGCGGNVQLLQRSGGTPRPARDESVPSGFQYFKRGFFSAMSLLSS